MVTERQGSRWLLSLRTNKGPGSTEKDETRNLFIDLQPGRWHLLSIQHSAASSVLTKAKVRIQVDNTRVSNGSTRSDEDEDRPFSHTLSYPFASSGVTQTESSWKFGVGFKGKLSSVALYPDELSPEHLEQIYLQTPHFPHHVRGISFPQSSFDTGHAQLGSLYSKAVPLLPAFCLTPLHLLVNACLPYAPVGRFNAEHIDMTQSTEGPRLLIPILSGETRVIDGSKVLDAWRGAGGVYLVLFLLWDICTTSDANWAVDSQTPVLNLLAALIRSSPDFKDQFLQLHGFHIVGHCLAQLSAHHRRQITSSLVDACTELTSSLGPDASKGDGIASALQGLLLNFAHVWGDTCLSVKKRLLESTVTLVRNSGDDLLRSIGVQPLVDIMHVYICGDVDSASNAAISREATVAGFELVSITLDAAIRRAKESKSKLLRDPTHLLLCLDACKSSSLLAENIFLTLWSVRSALPAVLLQALVDHSYAETTAVILLTQKGMSMKVRNEALTLLLWNLYENLRQIPVDLVQLRNAHTQSLNHTTQSNMGTVQARKSTFLFGEHQAFGTERPGISRQVVPLENSSHAKTIVKPLEKAWVNAIMIAESIELSIKSGAWGANPSFDDLVGVFAHDGPLGSVNAAIVLPLLHPFLMCQRCSLAACQKILMSVNVALKMDECQTEAIGTLEDRLWCSHFIRLACIGETHRLLLLADDDYESIADTCTELALDALSTVLEQKTRHHGHESNHTWTCLQSCLKTGCANSLVPQAELRFLKRCISLVFQRLARSADGWTASMISSVVNILALIEARELLSQSGRKQTQDEQQILFFLMDTLVSLRRASSGGALEGIERRVWRPACRIILKCLRCVSDDGADRICLEIIADLQHLSEPWGSQSPKSFHDHMALVFSNLRNAIKDEQNVDENVRDRYCALVYHILHHFIDLRHSRGSVPEHVRSTLDTLAGITQKDVTIIFQMLERKYDMPRDPPQPPPPRQNSQSLGGIGEEWTHPMNGSSFPPDEDLLGDSTFLSSGGESSVISVEELLDSPTHGKDLARSQRLEKWLNSKRGLVKERMELEHSRLKLARRSVEVSSEAIARTWAKLHRKIQTEFLCENLSCEWKLGVSHEGPFPGRKRVVLRPRYSNAKTSCSAKAPVSDTHALHQQITSLDVLKVGRELAKAYRITESSAPTNTKGCDEESQEADILPSAPERGLLEDDAAAGDTTTTTTLEDAAEADEEVPLSDEHVTKHGRAVETGPALPGTRKAVHSKIIFESRVMLVTASGNTWGTLSFNGKEIFFTSSAEGSKKSESVDSSSVNLASVPRLRRRRWVLSSVSAVYMRRYRLRNSALEVFFRRGKHRNFFVDFGYTDADEKNKNEFALALMTAAPKTAFLQLPSINNFSLVRLHGVQSKWLNGEISNFDYLMALNTISGRSFNDLCQYPVMPWVIAQYTEPTLDLKSPSSYRDLSKPMGALNEARLCEFLDRYESFDEGVSAGDMPRFLYGSHYSTMVGVVLHYLVRIQPFADLHKEMQGGHFDVADRLFSSIPRTWYQNTTQLSEVKEITPEWFTMPEVFKNVNKFNLGKTQDGEVIDDVVLPPWAKTAEEFVRLNRQALESDFVSENLHEWIDLIFGFKQQLPHSEKAHNVFFYLTYADQVDWKKLSQDDALREATELQISHFGQTPMQLFGIAHPRKGAARLFSTFVPRPLRKCFAATGWSTRMVFPADVEEIVSIKSSTLMMKQTLYPGSVAAGAAVFASRIVFVLDSGAVEVVKYGVSEGARSATAFAKSRVKQRRSDNDDRLLDFDLTHEPSPALSSDVEELMSNIPELIFTLQRELPVPPGVPVRVPTPACVPVESLSNVLLLCQSGKYIFSAGKVDGSVSVREIDPRTGFVKSEGDFCSHRSTVVHIAVDTIPNATTEVVASCDCDGFVLVWTVSELRQPVGGPLGGLFERESVISRRPQRVFRCKPHSELCCDISCKMGVVVACSGAQVYLFSIERDELLNRFNIREQKTDTNLSVRRVALCNDGIIVVHIEERLADHSARHTIEAFGLSGCSISLVPAPSPPTFLSCPAHDDVVVTGYQDGTVNILRSQNLDTLYILAPHISCLQLGWAGAAAVSARPFPSAPQSSPVLSVRLGPNPERPTLLVATCASGDVFIRALPDFVKWEKSNNPSTLVNLVSAPLEAVRTGVREATQTIHKISANALNLKDEALRFGGDALKELQRFSLWKK